MEKIRVLHIRDGQGIYGAERVILTLAKHMDRERFDFTLLCFQYGAEGANAALMDEARRAGVRVKSVKVRGRLDIRAILNIRRFLKNESIDILHTHDFKTTFYALLASLRLGTKRVVTAHGSTRDSFRIRAYLFLEERIVYRFFHKIIAVSESVARDLRKKRARAARLSVIPNGMDCLFPGSEAGEKFVNEPSSAPKEGKVFGVIGRLFPDKGHRYFLEGFRHIVRYHPEVKALIVGDGPLRAELKTLIESLRLNSHVELCGATSNIQEVYRRLDFLVIPSLTEGLPYVLLEALAGGIPVLATSVGDIPLLVRHGQTGFLVPPADPQALATYMARFLTRPADAKQMAQNGYQLVTERYSSRRMVEATAHLYEQLAQARCLPQPAGVSESLA